jgi:hypothetical protein
MVSSQYFLFMILMTCSTIHCRRQRNEWNTGFNERWRVGWREVWREEWRAIYCQPNPSAALVAALGNCFNQRPAWVCSTLLLKILQ